MPTEVILPRVDMDMTEGAITAWHAAEGEPITQGAPLFDIETSKATMEVEAPATGIVRRISADVGATVPVGTVIAWIYAEHEEAHELATLEERAAAVPQKRGDASLAVSEPKSESRGKARATPAARRVARERRIALDGVRGSGPLGRIVANDVPGEPASRARLNRIWLKHGDASTLVCLHGFAADANSWRPLVNAMHDARDTRVLAIDLPGHGKSPTDDACALQHIVAAIEAVLADERIDTCHVIGHSFGGAIAIALAAAIRAKVQTLTLLAPAGLGRDCDWAFIHGLTQAADRETLLPWLTELVHRPASIDEGFVVSALQQVATEQKRSTLASIAHAFFTDGRQQLDLRPLLAALTMPIRIVWGEHDRVMPIVHMHGLPGRVAQHRFAQVGHMPQIEAADEVARIVGEQLRLRPA